MVRHLALNKDYHPSSPVLGSVEAPEHATLGAKAFKLAPSSPEGPLVVLWNSLPTFSNIVSYILVPLTLPFAAFHFVFNIYSMLRTRNTLEGKVVLITGASSGLGKALAAVFYREGCRLILCSRNKDQLASVRLELLQKPSNRETVYPPVIVPMDLADIGQIGVKAGEALGIYGHVDLLVNNAGISYRGEVVHTNLEVDQQLMQVNYMGTVALTKAILPSMIQRKAGHVVMVSSVQGKIGIPFRSCYSASKHALQAFSDCLRAEVHQDKIGVTVIDPGYIQTNLSMNAVTGSGERYGMMDKTTASGETPEKVASEIIRAVKQGKKELVIASFTTRLAIYLRTVFPALFFVIMNHRASKKEGAVNTKQE
nr:EOG090X07KM [Triops cancriformis]